MKVMAIIGLILKVEITIVVLYFKEQALNFTV